MSSTLHVPIPDELGRLLASRALSEDELARWALEAILIEAYRERLLSRGKLGELLGLSFHEREAFLAERGVPYNYDPDDLATDARTLYEVLGRS